MIGSCMCSTCGISLPAVRPFLNTCLLLDGLKGEFVRIRQAFRKRPDTGQMKFRRCMRRRNTNHRNIHIRKAPE